MLAANETTALRTVRGSARLLAGFLVALILILFLGEGLAGDTEPSARMTARETAMMAFLAVCAGLLRAFRWELTGGLLTLGGLVAFYLVDYALSGTWPSGVSLLAVALPAALFVCDAYRLCHRPQAMSA